jgi:mannose/fructose/N-acetylgalactosamine-specific phosphotransferase system component IIB
MKFADIPDNYIDEYQLSSIIENSGKQKKAKKSKLDKEEKKEFCDLKEAKTQFEKKIDN